MKNDTFLLFPNIGSAMYRAGVSRKELALRLGISRSTLDRRLRGCSDFRWNELYLLHAVFPDLPVSFLLERSAI